MAPGLPPAAAAVAAASFCAFAAAAACRMTAHTICPFYAALAGEWHLCFGGEAGSNELSIPCGALMQYGNQSSIHLLQDCSHVAAAVVKVTSPWDRKALHNTYSRADVCEMDLQ